MIVCAVQVDEDFEKKKEDMAIKLSSGSLNVLQCEDLFEGLTPEVCRGSELLVGMRSQCPAHM